MLSASSPLLVLFLTVLQLVLLVDAKGGGKGAKGSKSSKKKPKTKVKHVYKENGKCYDEQYVVSPLDFISLIATQHKAHRGTVSSQDKHCPHHWDHRRCCWR